MKRWRVLWICIWMILVSGTPILAAVQNQSTTVCGVKVQMVKVDLEEGVKLRVAKGNGTLVGAQNFKSIIATYGAKAAINANFFDAYKTLEPMATIIKGKKVIHMVGNTASLMVFDDHKVKFDTLTLKYAGYLDGKRENYWDVKADKMVFNVFGIWYVNTPPNDSTGVYMYTHSRNKDIVLHGGKVVEVVNNAVVRYYTPQGKITIPENGYVIYYGKDAATEDYVQQRFATGRTVELELVDHNDSATFTYGEEQIPYSKIHDMIAAGPMVVKDGKNVASIHKKAFKEAKININSAQRSAIGVTKDNKLIMITCVATMEKLGEILLELGCVDGMNLDGGASSGLYGNGQYLKVPGRNLNTVLLVQ